MNCQAILRKDTPEQVRNGSLRVIIQAIILLAGFVFWADLALAQSNWRPVNLGWGVSCGADRGSITRSRKVRVFRTSANHCSGGIFNQRAEINTDNISINREITYLFETTVSFTSESNEPFVIFQIHDGRNGCSPPLSVRWQSNNTLSFDSDYTRDQGMDGCVQNREMRNARYSGPRLQRNGTPYQFRALLDFDGNGNFDVTIFIDGAAAISGHYQPSIDPGFVASSRFYMKHGVYSHFVWPYELRSEGMRVLRARN